MGLGFILIKNHFEMFLDIDIDIYIYIYAYIFVSS